VANVKQLGNATSKSAANKIYQESDPRFERTNFNHQVRVETHPDFPGFRAETRRLNPDPAKPKYVQGVGSKYTVPPESSRGRATVTEHCPGCVDALLLASRNGRAVNDPHNDSSF
jgi:hypothetical protein